MEQEALKQQLIEYVIGPLLAAALPMEPMQVRKTFCERKFCLSYSASLFFIMTSCL